MSPMEDMALDAFVGPKWFCATGFSGIRNAFSVTFDPLACKVLMGTPGDSFSAIFACPPWQLCPLTASVGPTWLCGTGSS